MVKYIKIREDGSEVLQIEDLPHFKINNLIEETIAMLIMRGNGKMTKSEAVRIAVFFYHKLLKEIQHVDDETVHPILSWLHEHPGKE